MNLEESIQQYEQLNQTALKYANRVRMNYKEMDLEGQCKLLSISPIQFVKWKYILFALSNLFLCIPLLITFWYQNTKRVFYYDFCQFDKATHVYVVNYDQSISICQLASKTFMISQQQSKSFAYFSNRYMNYIIDQEQTVRVSIFDYKKRIAAIFDSKEKASLSEAQAFELKNTYGPGTMILERTTCIGILFDVLLQPLNIFLIFCIHYFVFVVMYYYFTAVLFVVFAVGIIVNTFQRMKLNRKIQQMAFSELYLHVLRGQRMERLSSLQIVPGDIVFLKEAIKIPFEGVILQGNALINECALTGQSVPIVKKGDNAQNYTDRSKEIDKNAFVFEGTTIIQVNNKKKMCKFEAYRQQYGIPVCVIRTNFTTSKGQLIRLILFRKQRQNIFQKQSLTFLFYLGCFGTIIYVSLCIYLREYLQPHQYFLRFIDMIVLVIPAGIPVSMTFGIIYAVQRLEAKKIFCVVPNKVIDGGMIELCCFDKTGTLTEDYMDFELVVPCNNAQFGLPILNNQSSFTKMLDDAKSKTKGENLYDILTNMGSNHSIMKIQQTSELIGDPMQIKMFQFGKFVLNQSISDQDVIFAFQSQRGHSGKVLRRFQFDFDLQRMSVISQSSHTKAYKVYAKGSPEMMATIIDPATIPLNFSQIITEYASNGYRMLAIASKPIQKQLIRTIDRKEAESGMIFNGFEIFENKLKHETKQAINDLQGAQIKTVMITGDNSLTGSNISYECNISNEQKGMLIVDLIDDKHFTSSRFSYKNVQKQDQLRSLQFKNEQLNPAALSLDYIEIVFKTNQSKIAEKNRPYNMAFDIAETDAFMQAMSEEAHNTNSHLCITGRAFNRLFDGPVAEISQLKARFMNSATVFARTKPNDKAKIVAVYQQMKKKVSMCGDGANDCGALKQADIGLSLSAAQASMSAPFTSQVTNISSMVQLIIQCRCGLATNVSLFNIMAMYSLLIFTTTVIGNYFLQFPGNFHFLYEDIVLNFVFIIVLGYTKTATVLTPQKPSCSLLSFNNILQIVVMFLWQMIAQILTIVLYQRMEPEQYNQLGGMQNAVATYKQTKTIRNIGLEMSIIFLVTNNFFVASIVAFNVNKPWKQYFFTNVPLVCMLMISLTYNQIMIFWQQATYVQMFNSKYLPNQQDRWLLFAISAGFSFIIIFSQKLLLEPLSIYLRKKYPQTSWL